MTELAAGLALPQVEHLPRLVEDLRALQREVHLQLAALPGLQLVPDPPTRPGTARSSASVLPTRTPPHASPAPSSTTATAAGGRAW
ncbi:hypothetical protein ACFQ60_47585 [Streptomyces zhihengii]